MADTENYGWAKPTVSGDNNAWGAKLNTLFDAVDAQVHAGELATTAAQADADAAQAAAAAAQDDVDAINATLGKRVKCITPSISGAVINWAAESYDVGGFHSTSSQTSRIVVPGGFFGLLKLKCNITVQTVGITPGGAAVRIRKNGVTTLGQVGGSSIGDYLEVEDTPSVGDYYEVLSTGIVGLLGGFFSAEGSA